MELGRLVRLNRLFSHPSGRLCSAAVDRFIGYDEGLPLGLRQLRAARPDAVTMHKGIAASCWARSSFAQASKVRESNLYPGGLPWQRCFRGRRLAECRYRA